MTNVYLQYYVCNVSVRSEIRPDLSDGLYEPDEIGPFAPLTARAGSDTSTRRAILTEVTLMNGSRPRLSDRCGVRVGTPTVDPASRQRVFHPLLDEVARVALGFEGGAFLSDVDLDLPLETRPSPPKRSMARARSRCDWSSNATGRPPSRNHHL